MSAMYSQNSRDEFAERRTWGTAVSEKWQTVSMPSAVRRAKSAMYGPERIPDDPLHVLRTEVTEFDHVLQALEGCGRAVQAAVEMLSTAPTIMLDKLVRFFPEDAHGHELVLRFVHQQGLFSDRMKRGASHVEELIQRVQKMYEENNKIHEAFRRRDEVFTTSSHYERKVESLRGTVMRSSGGTKLTEKLNRNESKRIETQQALQEVSNEVEKTTEIVLGRKLTDTGEAIACICRYYAHVFDGADRLNSELGDIADSFVRPSPAQDMMRKGKEYASQAKEKAASFTAGARDRLSGATAAMSSKWQGYGGSDAPAEQRASTPTPGPRPTENRWGGFGDNAASGNGYGDAGSGFGAQSAWGSPPASSSFSGTPPPSGSFTGGSPPASSQPPGSYTGVASPWDTSFGGGTAAPAPGQRGSNFGGFGGFGGAGSPSGAQAPTGFGGGGSGGASGSPPGSGYSSGGYGGYGGQGQVNTPWGNPSNSMRR